MDGYKLNCSFIYTLSDKGNLFKDTLKSIKSLRRFVPKEKIYIYHTPPCSWKINDKLNIYGNVIRTNNLTNPFQFTKNRYGRYGEKIQLCLNECENVIFLDSDTIVLKNPMELLKYDFDVMGRIGTAFLDIDYRKWYELFKKYDKEPIPMINTGFLIFKNYSHHKIFNDWLKYMKYDIPIVHPTNYQKDQYAFSLAVSDLNIFYMNKSHHAFLWMNEFNETYVLHGTKRIRKEIRNKVGGLLKYVKI